MNYNKKLILNAGTEMPRNEGASNANSVSNINDSALGSSSDSSSASLSQQIHVGHSNNNAKVIEALENHDVLTEIFKSGSFRDLNNYRLINKQWKGVANSTIIKRRLWKLRFEVPFCGYHGNKNVTLVELNDCIEASGGSFPLTILDFTDVQDYSKLNSAALLGFYALMGQSIKRVIFNNFGPISMNEFQDLLGNKIPNVDHIDAGKIVFKKKKKEQCRFSIVLPNLETIRFIRPNNDDGQYVDDEPFTRFTLLVLPYYKQLLLAAVNLKEIQDFFIQLTNIVIEAGKVDCIQALNFALESLPTCSDLYVKFSLSEPKLSSLAITSGRNFEYSYLKLSLKCAENLKSILISSKDTLKHLHWLSCVFPADFQLPKFPNLEFLTLTNANNTYGCDEDLAFGLPDGCDGSEIFPKVHTVSFNNIRFHSASQTLFNYFRHQKFSTVTTLAFEKSSDIGRSWKRFFPNVSHIRTSVQNQVIFNRGFDLENQIESLEFHNCVVVARAGQGFQLDSLFTGAGRDVCANLLKMYDQRKARGEGDEDITMVKQILEAVQRPHYIFRNSEGLRRIKITFNHKDNITQCRIPQTSGCELDRLDSSSGDSNSEDSSYDENVEAETWMPVFTAVSCVYGFSLMPNLEEVIIGYDHYLPCASYFAQAFEPLAQFPYVKFLHEPTVCDE